MPPGSQPGTGHMSLATIRQVSVTVHYYLYYRYYGYYGFSSTEKADITTDFWLGTKWTAPLESAEREGGISGHPVLAGTFLGVTLK